MDTFCTLAPNLKSIFIKFHQIGLKLQLYRETRSKLTILDLFLFYEMPRYSTNLLKAKIVDNVIKLI